MLVNPSTEKLLKKAKNRYELTIAVSRRARQLINEKGAESKVSKAAVEFINNDCYIIREEK